PSRHRATSPHRPRPAHATPPLHDALPISNSAGSSAPATSNKTGAISWQQPTNTVSPSISGSAQVGQTLTAGTGSWSGYPTSYAYERQRCGANARDQRTSSVAAGGTYTAPG